MASGMELMLGNMLKSMGVDPIAIGHQVETTVKEFMGAMQALQLRLDAMDAKLDVINARLERLEIAVDSVDDGDNNGREYHAKL